MPPRRRSRAILFGGIALVIALTLGAVFAIPSAVETLGPWYAKRAELGELSLRASVQAPAQLVISELEFMPHGGVGRSALLRIQALSLSFSPSALFRARVAAIDAEGVEIRLSLEEERLMLGGLELVDFGANPAEAGAEPPLLLIPTEELNIENASVVVATSAGEILAGGRVYASIGTTGLPVGSLDLTSVLHDANTVLKLENTADGQLEGTLNAELGPVALALFESGTPANGSATVVARVAAKGTDSDSFEKLDATLDWTLDSTATSKGSLRVRQVDEPDSAGSRFEVTSEPIRVRAGNISLEDLRVEAVTYFTASGDLEVESSRMSAAHLNVDDTRVDGIEVMSDGATYSVGPADRAASADGALHLSNCLSVRAKSAVVAETFELREPIGACIRAAEDAPLLRFGRLNPSGATSPTYRAQLRIEPLAVEWGRTGDSTALLSGALPEIEAQLVEVGPERQLELRAQSRGGRLLAREAQLSLAGLGANLRLDLSASAESTADGAEATANFPVDLEIEINELTSLAEPALLAPGTLKGTGKLRGDLATADATFRLPGYETFQVLAQLEHHLTTGRGTAALSVPSLIVADAEAAAAASPALAGLAKISGGKLAATSEIRWSPNEFHSSLSAEIDGLDVATEYATLKNARGNLEFSKLSPLLLAEGSTLRAAELDAGTPLRDVVVELAIADGLLRIPKARGSLAGGVLGAEANIRIDEGTRHNVRLELTGGSLAEVLELAEVEGLSATGELSGSLPILIDGSAIDIRGGRVEAKEGGTIHYRPERAPAALSAAGDQGDLILRALRDFRFNHLVLTLSGDPLGDLHAKLELKGHSPDVENGRPIELNIDLSTNLAEYARAAQLARAFEKTGTAPEPGLVPVTAP